MCSGEILQTWEADRMAANADSTATRRARFSREVSLCSRISLRRAASTIRNRSDSNYRAIFSGVSCFRESPIDCSASR